jgi:hypothetical protein
MENEQSKIPNSTVGRPIAPVTTLQLRRTSDFIARYANNIQLESSAFDLKLVFGLLDHSGAAKQPPKGLAVDQHTSINLSWSEVKILLFFIQLHLAAYEKDNGKIKIPASAIPPEPPSVIPPQFDNPAGREGLDLIRRIRADFLASLSDS